MLEYLRQLNSESWSLPIDSRTIIMRTDLGRWLKLMIVSAPVMWRISMDFNNKSDLLPTQREYSRCTSHRDDKVLGFSIIVHLYSRIIILYSSPQIFCSICSFYFTQFFSQICHHTLNFITISLSLNYTVTSIWLSLQESLTLSRLM